MYSYKINDDGYICGERVNQPQSETGLINDRWYSEDPLEYMNPDGSYRYQIVDEILTETDFNYVTYWKNVKLPEVKSMCSDILTTWDWKTNRHLEQLSLVENGLLAECSLTNDEYLIVIQNKQLYRELSNLAETMITAISTKKEIDWADPLFSLDFSDIEVVKQFLKEHGEINE